uniref:Uncharacterized protein n=1 Tax=Lepeophtheirus salmonis TaxID=72036 RepID=A0A0K2VBQ7_LEPSM
MRACINLKKCTFCLVTFNEEYRKEYLDSFPLCRYPYNAVVWDKNPNRKTTNLKVILQKRRLERGSRYNSRAKRPTVTDVLQELLKSRQDTNNYLKSFTTSQKGKYP